MPLVINTNTTSINAQRHLSKNTNMLQKSMERLSSGFRINRAGDDAAGLQLSENLRTQIRGSQAALANVQDGKNVLNIADGALSVITENLQRMRELAVQAANDTYDASQRTAIKQEMDARADDITRIANATEFNGVALLDGNAVAAAMSLQVGPNNVVANDVITIGGAFAAASDGTTLGVPSDTEAGGAGASAMQVDSAANARTSIGLLDTAITTINTRRATIGSFVNQLESAEENLMIAIESFQAAESRIRNVDVAAESARMTQNQILQQSSLAMLSQANQAPQLALQLLQN